MRRAAVCCTVTVMIAAHFSAARGADAPARVCWDPARPCAGFQSADLSFPLVNDGVARADQRSAPFFAVILKTLPRCKATEEERARVQALFPSHKVFYSRFGCEDKAENNVAYTGVDAKVDFIAVYGGETRGTAAEVLARAKATQRFPGANLRRMQVIYAYP